MNKIVKDEVLEALEENIKQTEALLIVAREELTTTSKTDMITFTNGKGQPQQISKYEMQLRTIDTLTKDYESLVARYESMVKGEKENKKFWQLTSRDFVQLLLGLTTITASVGELLAIYSWQKNGYLIRKQDVSTITMPRPY